MLNFKTFMINVFTARFEAVFFLGAKVLFFKVDLFQN